MSEVVTFGLVALSAVFFVVDPIALVPIFLALTARENEAQRRAIAFRAVLTSTLTLSLFALAGHVVFKLFGISLGAFKIAGGVLLFLLSLDMMQARPSRTKTTPEEQQEGFEKQTEHHDVAVIPLAIPLLSGPGAIATVMVLMSQHRSWIYGVPVFAAIAITGAATYLMLRGASWMERRLSRTFMNVASRLMGLILAAVAVEFVVAGVRDVLPSLKS